MISNTKAGIDIARIVGESRLLKPTGFLSFLMRRRI
jgi:hypothetical protein